MTHNKFIVYRIHVFKITSMYINQFSSKRPMYTTSCRIHPSALIILLHAGLNKQQLIYYNYIYNAWNFCSRTLRERDNLSAKDTFHISISVLMYGVNTFSTSDKMTASLQGTKQTAPKCPLLGSRFHCMYNFIYYNYDTDIT